jgi:hypothetical protein
MGCSVASTAAAVHDALCGSMAITTRSERSAVVTGWYSSLRLYDDEWREGTPTFGFAGLSSATPGPAAPARDASRLRANPAERQV